MDGLVLLTLVVIYFMFIAAVYLGIEERRLKKEIKLIFKKAGKELQKDRWDNQ